MALTNMKMPADKDDDAILASDSPRYPWGLVITLDNDSLKLLKMGKLPKVGATIPITAEAKVIAIEERENEDETRREVRLQITDIDVQVTKEDAADAMFGS